MLFVGSYLTERSVCYLIEPFNEMMLNLCFEDFVFKAIILWKKLFRYLTMINTCLITDYMSLVVASLIIGYYLNISYL